MLAEPTKTTTSKPTATLRPATPFFQRQIKIGNANDAAEKEADHAADMVVEGKGLSDGNPFFAAAPPPPPIVNRKEKNEEEEVQREKKSSAETVAPADFSSKLESTQAGGRPLGNETRQHMESGFGADFSNVRIHTDGRAAQLSESVNAKAFTHGNNIYFNQGQYNPSSSQGKHLLAHELTHTIQQGAAPQQNQTISRKPKQVQRGLLDRAWNAVSGAVNSATEWAEDQLEAGIQWVKDQAVTFVTNMPGYEALCFILGQDPVSGRGYPRTGLNFLRAILRLVPFGDAFEEKLNQTGTLQEAGAFLDAQVAAFDLNLGGILGELAAIWRGISISDVRNPTAVFQRVANVFTSRLAQVVSFASNIARYFLDLIKRVIIRELAEFVRTRTRAYPLMTVALGYDPISDEAVERSPQNILQAILNLTPNGQEIYRQIVNSGALERILAYMTAVGARALGIAVLARANVQAAWAEITIENLLQPLPTFMRIGQLLTEPAIQLMVLVTDVVRDFLQMVKDALLGYLGRVAAQLPGFTLLTVILGRNPLTGERVARTPVKLLQGFLELIPGGESYYQQLLASGVIDRMLAWITQVVIQFMEIGASISNAFTELWREFTWAALANPMAAFARVIAIIIRPVGRIVAFVADVVKQFVFWLLQRMGFPVELLKKVMARVMQTIGDITKDMLGLLRNLMVAVKQGFTQFFENIITHLLRGASDSLLDQLDAIGITPPKEFTPRAIFGMVTQILGITVDRIWQKIVQRIGPERAARLHHILSSVSGAWAFVKDVMTRGPIALWEYVKNQLSNLWDRVLEGVQSWLFTRIIQQAITRLLSMLDPTGIMAVINSFVALFRVIQSFVQQLQAMLQVLESLADSVMQIALGGVAEAANFLEQSLVRALSVVISFLANLAGLGRIGNRIGEMIGRVRDTVERAIDWLIDRAVRLGGRMLDVAGDETSGAERNP